MLGDGNHPFVDAGFGFVHWGAIDNVSKPWMKDSILGTAPGTRDVH